MDLVNFISSSLPFFFQLPGRLHRNRPATFIIDDTSNKNRNQLFFDECFVISLTDFFDGINAQVVPTPLFPATEYP